MIGSVLEVSRQFGIVYWLPVTSVARVPLLRRLDHGLPGQLLDRVRADREGGRDERVLQGGDRAVCIDAGPDVHELRHPVVVPAVVVLAAELDAHRSAGELRHDRRGGAGLEPAGTAAEAARSLDPADPHRLLRQPEDHRQLLLQLPGGLRAGVDDRAVRPHVRHRAPRADRRMAVVGDEVLPGNDVRGRGQRRVHVPGVHGAADGRQAGRLLGAHVGGKVRVARQRRRIGPGHL